MADVESGVAVMAGTFRPFEKLIEITIMGKTFLVPERNSVLRAFQFISPETIPYGRFCSTQDCGYCRAECKLPDEDHARPIQACEFMVSEGISITKLSPELMGCMRSKIGHP